MNSRRCESQPYCGMAPTGKGGVVATVELVNVLPCAALPPLSLGVTVANILSRPKSLAQAFR